MTQYMITLKANAVVSQTVEVNASDEQEAFEKAEESAMCYYGDFEIDDADSIEILEKVVEMEWDEV